jgi:hypothetical protein
MPRPSKLTPEVQLMIIERLGAGATIKATCDSVGIGTSTFYQWIDIGKAYRNGIDHDRMPRLIKDREIYADFADETTRAQADGMITAAIQFKKGMLPQDSKTTTTKTTTETRVDKNGELYDYTKTETTYTTTHHPGDWRAAMEYLARRDPENWARQKISHELTGKDGGAIEFKLTYPKDNDADS